MAPLSHIQPTTRRNPFSFHLDGAALYLLLLAICAFFSITFLVINHFTTPGLSAPGFPIDDGYIYSNYVRQAANGLLFHYTPAGSSGGITGFLWYILLVPLRLVVNTLTTDELARATIPAYLLSIPLLALAAWLSCTLSRRALATLFPAPQTVAFSYLPALTLLLVFANPRMIWTELSGLELPISLVLVTLAIYLFLVESAEAGVFKWSILVIALLPWARPDLFAIAALLAGISIGGAVLRRWPWAGPMRISFSLVGSAILLASVYLIGYGRPLPSSFFAKALAIPVAAGQAAQAVASTGSNPFLLLLRLVSHNFDSVLAPTLAFGVLAVMLLLRKWFLAPALLSGVILLHFAAITVAIHGYSVESRYVLPVWPLASILLTVAIAAICRMPVSYGFGPRLSRSPLALATLSLALVAAVVVNTFVWAFTTYVPTVQYSYDNDFQSGTWVQDSIAPSDPVAIGNAGLVTTVAPLHTAWVDIYGLTSPDLSDHVSDQAFVWNYLREHNVRYSTVCWPDQSWVTPAPAPYSTHDCLLDWTLFRPH